MKPVSVAFQNEDMPVQRTIMSVGGDLMWYLHHSFGLFFHNTPRTEPGQNKADIKFYSILII